MPCPASPRSVAAVAPHDARPCLAQRLSWPLYGCRLLLSGVFPREVDARAHPLVQRARMFGAEILPFGAQASGPQAAGVLAAATHVVAGRGVTGKVQEAAAANTAAWSALHAADDSPRVPVLAIVTFEWLQESLRRYRRMPEPLFALPGMALHAAPPSRCPAPPLLVPPPADPAAPAPSEAPDADGGEASSVGSGARAAPGAPASGEEDESDEDDLSISSVSSVSDSDEGKDDGGGAGPRAGSAQAEQATPKQKQQQQQQRLDTGANGAAAPGGNPSVRQQRAQGHAGGPFRPPAAAAGDGAGASATAPGEAYSSAAAAAPAAKQGPLSARQRLAAALAARRERLGAPGAEPPRRVCVLDQAQQTQHEAAVAAFRSAGWDAEGDGDEDGGEREDWEMGDDRAGEDDDFDDDGGGEGIDYD